MASFRGFTLIELVLVIVVMAIASLGLAAVIQQALFDTHKPEVISTAAALAGQEAERLIRLPFTSIVDEHRDNPKNYTGNFQNYSWEVRVDSIDNAQPNLGSDPTMQDYKMVEVRVHHGAINYTFLKFLKTNH